MYEDRHFFAAFAPKFLNVNEIFAIVVSVKSDIIVVVVNPLACCFIILKFVR